MNIQSTSTPFDTNKRKIISNIERISDLGRNKNEDEIGNDKKEKKTKPLHADDMLLDNVEEIQEKQTETSLRNGLEEARVLLAGILNQLAYSDFPANNNTLKVEKHASLGKNEKVKNPISNSPKNKSNSLTIKRTETIGDHSSPSTAASTQTFHNTNNLQALRFKNSEVIKMGHASLVDLCSSAIESSLKIVDEDKEYNAAEDADSVDQPSSCPSDEKVQDEASSMCFMPCPNFESWFSNRFKVRDKKVVEKAQNQTSAPVIKPSFAETLPPRIISSIEDSDSHYSELKINPSSSFSTAIDEDTKRIQMFGSEYARFLSSTPFSPSVPTKKPKNLKRLKKKFHNSNFYAKSDNTAGYGTYTLEEAHEGILTGAVTDIVITHGNEKPPKGFFRISRSGSGEYDADLTVNAGEMPIFLNVKKEPNWNRAVQRPYIISLVVIFPDLSEFVPPGYTVVRYKNLPANLNHGTIGKRVYLCYKRSREGNPITGIVPLLPTKMEVIPDGYTVIERTPRNFIANVNSDTGSPVFLAIRQRLANLETLRPIPLLASGVGGEMKAYYCTGGSIVHCSLGKCHIMDRSRHPMISPSSVHQRLKMIESSRDMKAPHFYPSSDTIYLTASASTQDSESVQSLSSNLLIQSLIHHYMGQSNSQIEEVASNSTMSVQSKNTPYIDSHSAPLDFIPIITNANSQPTDLARVLVLTPILTCAYTHHGGVSRKVIESLVYLLNETDFFVKDFRVRTPDIESHTLLDISLQVVCDVSTSTARETIFQPCVDFVFDAISFSNGNLNTRTLGYAMRMLLFVFYFGASMPNSTSWPFCLKLNTPLLLEEHDNAAISAPQAAALVLKKVITISLSRLKEASKERKSKTKPASHHDPKLFIHEIVQELIESAMNAVDVSHYTQLASHQILRSGGSELFWYEMITSCGNGLFGKSNFPYVIAFGILASIVKISSGNLRYIEGLGESIPRDVHTKILSLELLSHFIQNCHSHENYDDNNTSLDSSNASVLAYTIRRLAVPCLLNNTLSALEDVRIYSRILSIITVLWVHFRSHLKVEMAILFDHFLLRMLKVGPQVKNTRKNVTAAHQLEALEKVTIWFQCPVDILELYLNYDMNDTSGVSNWKVCQLLCNILCTFAEQCGDIVERIRATPENQVEENMAEIARKRDDAKNLQVKALETICNIMRSMLDASLQIVYDNNTILDSTSSSIIQIQSTVDSYSDNNSVQPYFFISRRSSSGLKEKQADQKKNEDSMRIGFEILEDKGLKKALDYLVACNILTPSPRDVASFLRLHQSRINPLLLGDYLGEGGHDGDEDYWNLVRYHFIRAISFAGMNVEAGLRHLLTRCGFVLPGEAQRIDRILNTFAQCFFEDSAGDTVNCPFKHQDTVYLLSYAIIMLNTDLHKANGVQPSSHISVASSNPGRSISSNKRQIKRMSKVEFISNLRGADFGELTKDYLSVIYDSVEANPIIFSSTPSSPSYNGLHMSKSSLTTKTAPGIASNAVKSLTKNVKPSLELMRGLAFKKHCFHILQDDNSLLSTDFLRLIFGSTWHHFHSIVLSTLGAIQVDPKSVRSCLQILQSGLCITIVLEMEREKKAFIIQLARIKFLMERGLEDGASRVYSKSVQDANFVVGEEFKHEKWYKQMEAVCTSTNRMDAVNQVLKTVEQLKNNMPTDGSIYPTMKKITESIRNGGILLNNPTRSFVYEGDLIKRSSRSGHNTMYRFFLFSDVLLYAHKSASKGDFKVHESLLLYMMKIIDSVPNISKRKHLYQYGFQIHHPRKSFFVFCPSQNNKRIWIDVLNSTIRRAVERKAGLEGAAILPAAP